jgi:hypothetical protein
MIKKKKIMFITLTLIILIMNSSVLFAEKDLKTNQDKEINNDSKYTIVMNNTPIKIYYIAETENNPAEVNIITFLKVKIKPKETEVGKNSMKKFEIEVQPPEKSGIHELMIIQEEKTSSLIKKIQKTNYKIIKHSEDEESDDLIEISSEVRFPNKLLIILKNYGTNVYKKIMEVSTTEEKIFVELQPNEIKEFEFDLPNGEHIASVRLDKKTHRAEYKFGLPELTLVRIEKESNEIIFNFDWNKETDSKIIYFQDGQTKTVDLKFIPGDNKIKFEGKKVPEKLFIQNKFKTFKFDFKEEKEEEQPKEEQSQPLMQEKIESVHEDISYEQILTENKDMQKVMILVFFVLVSAIVLIILKNKDKKDSYSKKEIESLLEKYQKTLKEIEKKRR